MPAYFLKATKFLFHPLHAGVRLAYCFLLPGKSTAEKKQHIYDTRKIQVCL